MPHRQRAEPRVCILCAVHILLGEYSSATMGQHVQVESTEISAASLRVALPWYTHLYTLPFLSLYPVWAYAYLVKYDDWIQSEEWTFVGCVLLGAGHALSFLVTRWNAGAKAWITTRTVCDPLTLCSE